MDQNGNGHRPAGLPDGARVPTLEELRTWSRRWVKLPAASELAGYEVGVWIRAIRRQAYFLMLPSAVPGSDKWPDAAEERVRLYNAWIETQPEGTRDARAKRAGEIVLEVVILGVCEPKLTPETVLDLGADLDLVHDEILTLTGLQERKKPVPEPVAG